MTKTQTSNTQIKSVLEAISTAVFTTKWNSLEEAKQYVINAMEGKSISLNDYLAINKAVKEAPTMVKLQQYLCNSLLKYEGMGVGAKKRK
jgi:hypothetical protein